MQISYISSRRVNLDFHPLGNEAGEYFALKAILKSGFYSGIRVGYIREYFGFDAVSNHWLKVWLPHNSIEVFRLNDFTLNHRTIEFKAANIADFSVEFYRVVF